MPISATFVEPEDLKGETRGEVPPGATVRIVAGPATSSGKWEKDGHPQSSAPDGALQFVMDAASTNAGSYVYRDGDRSSDAVVVRARPHLLGRAVRGGAAVLVGSAVYAAVVFLIFFFGGNSSGALLTGLAYAFAALTVCYGLVLVHHACRASGGSGGLATLFQGDDRRTSTSKTQYLLWTLLVVFALAYIGGRVMLRHGTSFACSDPVTKNCVPTADWETYLLLLGVPAAAAVSAKGITAYKVQSGQLQKTTAEGARVADIATNDDGKADLADVQYLLFNVIALTYVAVNLVRSGTLVVVPDLLLGLTSTAAATYVLNKTLQSNAPVITSVVPGVVRPGTTLTIGGQNLFPPGSPDLIEVKIGGQRAVGARGADHTVRVVAPPGLSGQDPTVAVVTSARVESAPYPVVVEAVPAVTGWVGGAPAPGTPGRLAVDGLPPSETEVLVLIGQDVLPARSDAQGVVALLVPPGGSQGPAVPVSVKAAGAWSNKVHLPIA